MQKFLTYDQLARADRFVCMRARRVAEIRADQVSSSISRQARQLAGFTDAEIERFIKVASASVAY